MEDLQKKIIFARNLKMFMGMRHISRQEFAEALGFKYSTVSEWLQGNKYPRKDKLEAMAKYFSVSIKALVEPPNLIGYSNRDIGEEIRKAREKMHLTQEELAQNGGFRPRAVFNWEQGAFTNKNIPDLNRLCDFLGLDPEIFMPIQGFKEYRSLRTLVESMEKEFAEIELQPEEMEQILDFAKFVVGKRVKV